MNRQTSGYNINHQETDETSRDWYIYAGFAESFFATFKKEELYHREYHSYEELKKGIDEYILFYNQVRPHKKLKYVSPCEFEEAYYKNLQS